MIITSTSKKFSGHVVLPDYLNIRQVKIFEETLPTAEQLQESIDNPEKLINISVGLEKKIPTLIACVSEWHIKGVPEKPTVDTFPATPPKAVNDFVKEIYQEIQKIYIGEIEIPND